MNSVVLCVFCLRQCYQGGNDSVACVAADTVALFGESLITGLFNLVKSANRGQTSVSCDLASRPISCSTKGIPTELNSMLV